jgi:LAS superfamily LD-carboxypeptidase LdcB
MKENVPLSVVSGTRNFNEQKSIWENKWKKESTNNLSARETAIKILAYSSMPSTSRHHWGTDIDINSVESEYFRSEPGISAYNWLAKNANRFGFYQTYTSKENGRTGYSVEEWHWSYLPLATHYLQLYNQKISNSDIVGFSGCETATEIDILKNYVNGVEKY